MKTYLQEKLTAGDNIRIENNVISADVSTEDASKILIPAGSGTSVIYSITFTDAHPMLSLYISGWTGTIREPSLFWIDWEHEESGTWSPRLITSDGTKPYFGKDDISIYIGRRNDDGASRQLVCEYNREKRTLYFHISHDDVSWIVSKY